MREDSQSSFTSGPVPPLRPLPRSWPWLPPQSGPSPWTELRQDPLDRRRGRDGPPPSSLDIGVTSVPDLVASVTGWANDVLFSGESGPQVLREWVISGRPHPWVLIH